eukprot:COSAG01_NODE_5470_length_4241_cov_3.935297_4_plen_180_part_00
MVKASHPARWVGGGGSPQRPRRRDRLPAAADSHGLHGSVLRHVRTRSPGVPFWHVQPPPTPHSMLPAIWLCILQEAPLSAPCVCAGGAWQGTYKTCLPAIYLVSCWVLWRAGYSDPGILPRRWQLVASGAPLTAQQRALRDGPVGGAGSGEPASRPAARVGCVTQGVVAAAGRVAGAGG